MFLCESWNERWNRYKWNNKRVKHLWVTMSQQESTWVMGRWVTWESNVWLQVNHVRKGRLSVMWPTIKVHVINKRVKIKEKLYVVTCRDTIPLPGTKSPRLCQVLQVRVDHLVYPTLVPREVSIPSCIFAPVALIVLRAPPFCVHGVSFPTSGTNI